jgi:predicted RNA binding protein YcfA (HicA-like mRNA interferase family)
MPRLTPVSWKQFDKFLTFVGCEFKRARGDHRIYWRNGLDRPIVIPRDTELPIFIIRNNLRVLGLSVDEYLKIMERI